MINPFKDVNWNPDRAARRTFALSLIVGFPVIAIVFLVVGWLAGRGWNLGLPLRIGGYGTAAGLVFLLVPAIARPFYVVWYALACTIGLVVSNVLVTLVFFVIFTGIGLAMRMLGRRPLDIAVDRSSGTYWIDNGPPPDVGRYLRQF